MPSKKKSVIDFEAALNKLGEIVTRMEQGDLTLEESLTYFEEGIILTRECQTALKQAEQKVQILTAGQDDTTLNKFVDE